MESSMSAVHVFVCFDIEHDRDLYDLILEQARSANSGFAVASSSDRSSAAEDGGDRVRRRIRAADQVIVLCGEHTEASTRMTTELRMAHEEGTPYFLVWGRREIMCTKPIGAKASEGMYSWTRQNLEDQITLVSRKVAADAAAKIRADALRKH